MLTLLAKQQTKTITVYLDTETITVKQLENVLESYIDTQTLRVKVGTPTITADIYVKPPEAFTYEDGGLYNQEGVAVDALYYNTSSWNETWNGGYA
jgi:hypothetical protein